MYVYLTSFTVYTQIACEGVRDRARAWEWIIVCTVLLYSDGSIIYGGLGSIQTLQTTVTVYSMTVTVTATNGSSSGSQVTNALP